MNDIAMVLRCFCCHVEMKITKDAQEHGLLEEKALEFISDHKHR